MSRKSKAANRKANRANLTNALQGNGSASQQRTSAALNPSTSSAATIAQLPVSTWMLLSAVVVLAGTLWAYWPTLVAMVDKWGREPDYSHGYLVLPIALFFLWSRRSTMPIDSVAPSAWGIALLAAATLLRVLAGLYYLQPLDGWTLPLTVAGLVCLLYGQTFLLWSLPAIVFLWFMMPIPYSAERWLSVPLQAIATKLSTAILVFLGQPAIAEGNVLLLGDHTLFVEEACSGMRIFVGIFALAFAFALFSRWAWWEKAIVLMAALPLAIIANVTRIVATGLLYQLVSSDAGHKFSHDIAGFVMIPFAALLMWGLLIYLDKLFPQVEDVSHAELLRARMAQGNS